MEPILKSVIFLDFLMIFFNFLIVFLNSKGNIDQSYQSVHHFTQCAIVCDSNIVSSSSKYGYNKIFEPMIKDLETLETKGIEIEYKNQKVNLKGEFKNLF